MHTLFTDETNAIFSPCRTWRYTLNRQFGSGNGRACMFLMLNPSTADEVQNDPTIRRCINFAKAWGYSRLTVCNIFAYRSTDPKGLRQTPDPIGPYNDHHIVACHSESLLTIAAWGVHGEYLGRAEQVVKLLADSSTPLMCLGKTKDGQPKHPLYVAGATVPALYRKGSGDDR